jgi:hypothetical protein
VPQEIRDSYHNEDFSVQARTSGGDWQDLFEYKVTVDLDHPETASMVQFDLSGTVEIQVKVNKGTVNDVKIRPLAKGIQAVTEGNTVSFTLTQPEKLSLEVNGDRMHNLHVFANEMETETYAEDDPGVMYFGAGVHRENSFYIPSNTIVYLAPGAIVQGKFICSHSENVRILGRGFILKPERGFEIAYSDKITIDGITVINPKHYTVFGGQSTNLTIRNLKSFSSDIYSDGIDLMSCSDVSISDVFMRNSDDCIALYAHRWIYSGDVRNYYVSDAILWADVAHPVNIGLHGNIEGEGETLANLHFSNIDILEHDEDYPEYQGCIAFNVGDKNLVQDVTFENVRIEDIEEGQLFNLRVLFNTEFSLAPGRGIRNVLFKDIYYSGQGENPSVIAGYDASRTVEDVTFENIVINGKKAAAWTDANIRIGSHVRNIIIK